jgi:hypothetical protein
LAAGPFLPVSTNWIERHVKLPPEYNLGVRDRHRGGVRTYRQGLAAAQVHGDSMIGLDIIDGDITIFQRSEFDYLENGKIVLIEKLGEEEGFGAWALKEAYNRAASIISSK